MLLMEIETIFDIFMIVLCLQRKNSVDGIFTRVSFLLLHEKWQCFVFICVSFVWTHKHCAWQFRFEYAAPKKQCKTLSCVHPQHGNDSTCVNRQSAAFSHNFHHNRYNMNVLTIECASEKNGFSTKSDVFSCACLWYVDVSGRFVCVVVPANTRDIQQNRQN